MESNQRARCNQHFFPKITIFFVPGTLVRVAFRFRETVHSSHSFLKLLRRNCTCVDTRLRYNSEQSYQDAWTVIEQRFRQSFPFLGPFFPDSATIFDDERGTKIRRRIRSTSNRLYKAPNNTKGRTIGMGIAPVAITLYPVE